MRITHSGWLVALMTSIVFAASSCVVDNTGEGDLPSADDDDAGDDDSAAEDEVCPGSALAFWTNWFRDVDGDGCLSRFERDDLDTDQWVAVATCTDGTFSTVWEEGAVSAGLPSAPFFNPTDPASLCEEDGDDDVAADDDTSDDDDVADDDDTTPADDDDAVGDDDDSDADDDDDTSGDGPATGPTACPPFGEWGVVWVRWWADADGDGCLDPTESDDSSSDLWVDVGVCPDGADHPYSYWDMSQWVYDLPPSPPFLAGNGGNACP